MRFAILPVVLAAAFAMPSGAAEDTEIYSVRIPYVSGDELGKLTQLLDHPYVDQAAHVVHAEVSPEELAKVQQLGMSVQIDEAETARIQKFISTRAQDVNSGAIKRALRATPSSIANGVHSCYRTVEQVYSSFEDLAKAYPKFVKIQTLGKSWMGTQQKIPPIGTSVPDNSQSSFANLLIKYLPASIVTRFNLSLFPVDPSPIKVLIVGNFEKQDKQTDAPPSMVWTGGIHAREYAPQEVGIKFIEWLLDNYGKDANATMMVDTNRYHFIVHNPMAASLPNKTSRPASARTRTT